MAKPGFPYTWAKRLFAATFVVSTGLLIVFALASRQLLMAAENQTPVPTTPSSVPHATSTRFVMAIPGTPTPSPAAAPALPPTNAAQTLALTTDLPILTGVVATATSCFASFISFVGFCVTTLLGWRKEGREARAQDLERQRGEIALERERLELARLRAEQDKEQGKP